VDTLQPPPKGALVRLRLTQRQESFEAEARVMYVSKGLGMGVRFSEPVAPEQLAKLERWLAEVARKL